MDKVESLNHMKWDCKYHVVFIQKCRRKVLYGELLGLQLSVRGTWPTPDRHVQRLAKLDTPALHRPLRLTARFAARLDRLAARHPRRYCLPVLQ